MILNEKLMPLAQHSRDWLILVSLGFAFVINIVLWVLAIGKFGYAHELIPLHFNIVYGIDYVGSSRQIYELPGAGLIVLLLNGWLGGILYRQERFLSYFLWFSALVMQGFLFLILTALIILNG